MSRPSGSRLAEACAHLDSGDWTQALGVLDRGSPTQSPGERAAALVARGLLHEHGGEGAAAEACFLEALDLAVPLPALLRQMGRYFKRTGEWHRAYRCYSLLRTFDRPGWIDWPYRAATLLPRQPKPASPRIRAGADALSEFLDGLPAAELARYAPWAVRELIETIGLDVWYLPVIKEALVERHGAQEAAELFAVMARKRRGWDVRTLPLAGLRDFAHAEHLVYRELLASRMVSQPTPPALPRSALPALEVQTRAVFLTALPEAVVSSQSNVVICNERAVLDFQADELTRFPIDLGVDPTVFGSGEDGITLLTDESARSEPPIEEAFHLVGTNSGAFGHWILEFLPKVLACLEDLERSSMPILVDEEMPAQHLQALDFFLGRDHPRHVLPKGEAVRVHRLWCCSMINYLPLGFDAPSPLDGEAFARLLAKVRSKLDATQDASAPQRIYLSRGDRSHRRLKNRKEVEAWFSARGFTILELETLEFVDQVRVARSADVIVGPEGSSLMMSYFARAGTRIGVLDNPYLEHHRSYELVCRCLGQRLLILTGEVVMENPTRTKSDYRVAPDRLDEFLDLLLAP